jgi:hypothetical protein
MILLNRNELITLIVGLPMMKHDKGYFRSSIRRHGTSNRKFSHSNRFILQKNSPACTANAVLRKYGGTSARCTSFGPYFNNGIQNPFYIELAQIENYYGERLRNQASFTVGFTGGGGCH